MSTPINKDLRELRLLREHYVGVLKQDALNKEQNIERVRLLSEEDIGKINLKISSIDVAIEKLLVNDKDY